jgi:lipid II:glycine glycyltransferase (peptidoglycan interpeptide bridge formation enzyme)
MLEVKKIDDKIKWNNFLLNQPTQAGIFLQSAEWLDFQETVGHKTLRLAAKDEQQNISSLCGIIENKLPFHKKNFYIPRGPIESSKYNVSSILYENLLKETLRLAKQENAIFIRVEPSNTQSKIQNTKYKIQNTLHVQPEHTLVLELEKSEDDLLAAMHEKTRYNIRLAEKKNLVLKNGNLEDFWKLMKETTARDKFRPHPKKYYETMLGKINGDGKKEMRVELKIVYSGDMPLAAAIIGYFGDTATYLHGASSHEYRNLMAPYFLHWEIIKEAKKLGYKFYDFWGIDEKKWPGVTRFKKGFGGFEINYPGTFDLPINKFWYKIYNLTKKIF